MAPSEGMIKGGAFGYTHLMSSERKTPGERLGRYWWVGGVIALAAWFALLWFMFGDVL